MSQEGTTPFTVTDGARQATAKLPSSSAAGLAPPGRLAKVVGNGCWATAHASTSLIKPACGQKMFCGLEFWNWMPWPDALVKTRKPASEPTTGWLEVSLSTASSSGTDMAALRRHGCPGQPPNPPPEGGILCPLL